MTEKTEKEHVFDPEWEMVKLNSRLHDIWHEIDNCKAKIRSNSARISRLKSQIAEERVEEYEEEREEIPESLQFSEKSILDNLKAGESLEVYLEKLRRS